MANNIIHKSAKEVVSNVAGEILVFSENKQEQKLKHLDVITENRKTTNETKSVEHFSRCLGFSTSIGKKQGEGRTVLD